MPMSFPDFDSIKEAAQIHRFREPHPNETEAHFRAALAEHVLPIDRVESHEIRTGVPADQWGAKEVESFVSITAPRQKR